MKNQALLFDLDNTFYPYQPCHEAGLEASLKGSAAAGIEKQAMREAYAQARQGVHQRLLGQAASHSRLLYFHEALESLGDPRASELSLSLEHSYWDSYFVCMKATLDSQAVGMLGALRRASVKLGLVTDLTTQVQFKKIKYLGIAEYFDVVVTSEAAGREKPDPSMLRLALEKLNVNAEQAAVLGDSPQCDGQAAASLGMDFYWMRQYGEAAWPKELQAPQAVINTWGELATLVGVSLGDR